MGEMDRETRPERSAPGERRAWPPKPNYYFCCWPGNSIWAGAFLVAIGAGMMLSELEIFAAYAPELVWGIILIGFGIFTLVWGVRRGEWDPRR